MKIVPTSTWKVPSRTSAATHNVDLLGSKLFCPCMGWRYSFANGGLDGHSKHCAHTDFVTGAARKLVAA